MAGVEQIERISFPSSIGRGKGVDPCDLQPRKPDGGRCVLRVDGAEAVAGGVDVSGARAAACCDAGLDTHHLVLQEYVPHPASTR